MLIGLLEGSHTPVSEVETQFFENTCMKDTFFNESSQTDELSPAGKQTLKKKRNKELPKKNLGS